MAKSCYNLNKILSYYPTRGFSFCCSKKHYFKSYDNLLKSDFSSKIYKKKFSDMQRKVCSSKSYYNSCEVCLEYWKNNKY